MATGNLAYNDYRARLDEAIEEQGREERKISVKHVQYPSGSAAKIIFAAVAVGILLCCLIYGKFQTNNMYNEISNINNEIELLRSENVRMQSELEGMMSMKNIEEYAENILKLKKLDKSQIEYIQVQSSSVVEIPEKEDNFFVKIRSKFEGLVEYLRG